MSDEPAAQSEINPRRRFLFISLMVISIGICLVLLTATGPTIPAFQSMLRNSGLLPGPQATSTQTPMSTAIPGGTPASTVEVLKSTEVQQGASEGDPPTRAVTPTEGTVQGNGRCRERCNPASSNCLPGLDCISGGSSNQYVCWNAVICVVKTPETTPPITCNFDGICDSFENPVCTDCLVSWTPEVNFCSAQVCGDGRCTPCQVDLTCAADCQAPPCTCGDGQCRAICGETPETCSQDCGRPSTCVCGDNLCSADCGENAATCRQDCNPCASSSCGDGVCRIACGESPLTCQADCGLP